MRVFITGIDGFTGKHLSALIQSKGHEVFGLTHRNIECHAQNHIHPIDLADTDKLSDILNQLQPDWIIHLAAIAFVAHRKVSEIYHTNILGTRNLLDAISTQVPNVSRVLLASSANIYGNSSGGILTENSKPSPNNDYAVSKLAMEHVANLYVNRLPLITVRPFNYTGVGQSTDFLIPKIVGHFQSRAPAIELGNLDVARDFSDVRNVIEAYCRLIEAPSNQILGQIFNVCSEVPTSLRDILNMVSNISGHELKVSVNPAFVRANEVKTLTGSCAKLETAVGKLPKRSLYSTLEWMLSSA